MKQIIIGYRLYGKIWWPSFLARRRTELASVRDKKRGHRIFPYEVYILFIIYFHFHLETKNHSIFNHFYWFYRVKE
jgi:hypothetical protein